MNSRTLITRESTLLSLSNRRSMLPSSKFIDCSFVVSRRYLYCLARMQTLWHGMENVRFTLPGLHLVNSFVRATILLSWSSAIGILLPATDWIGLGLPRERSGFPRKRTLSKSTMFDLGSALNIERKLSQIAQWTLYHHSCNFVHPKHDAVIHSLVIVFSEDL